MTELTLKVLDEMAKLRERNHRISIVRIYLNLDDWLEAGESMEKLAAPYGGRTPDDMAFGIPVQVTEALESGTFALEYVVTNDSRLVVYKVVP